MYTSMAFSAIVKIFSAQPPLRIVSFETDGSLAANKRFLRRVDKWLMVRGLSAFCFQKAIFIISSCGHLT